MRMIGKASFFEAARTWRVRDVAAAVREQPEFASLRDPSGRTALHVCARQSASGAKKASAAVATARVLLAAGADVNAIHPIQDGEETFPATALWHALAWGRNRLLGTYLLKHGADPNNCMFAMVYDDNLPTARLLRRHGARIDEVFHRETPLIYAMRHRRARFGEWLVSEGESDLQGWQWFHSTPLRGSSTTPGLDTAGLDQAWSQRRCGVARWRLSWPACDSGPETNSGARWSH